MLFRTFAAFAVLGMRLIDGRWKHEMCPAQQRNRTAVAATPLWSALIPFSHFAIDILLYSALIWQHPQVIGVSTLPLSAGMIVDQRVRLREFFQIGLIANRYAGALYRDAVGQKAFKRAA